MKFSILENESEEMKMTTMTRKTVRRKMKRVLRVTIETICGGAIMFAVGYVCIILPLMLARG